MEPLRSDLPAHHQQQHQLSLVATLPALIAANNGAKTPEAPETLSSSTKKTAAATTIASTSTTISIPPSSQHSVAHHNIHQVQHHSPNPQHQHQHHHHPQLQQQHSISATSTSTVATASVISAGGAQQTIEKLSRPAAFDKMESLVREMQDPENGVPVRQQKMFLTSIPYAFMGYDLIEWLMDRLLIEESEALNIANQLCLHGYFFPVNDTKTLVVKDDSSLYRFQTPYYWPWQHKAPDNVEYAIYLAKRSLRNKQRHALEDYEVEALSSLHKNLKGKWDIISMQAEEQVRLAKERKKGDKIVGDSQERAYWRVHRPPPGQFTPLEPCPVPMRDRQGTKAKKKQLEDVQREVDYLTKILNRTRMKMSKACDSLVNYAETFAEYDAFMQPPLPSNPWVTEDTTFWQLNNTYVEAPTEKRVRRWAISIEELVGDPTGLQEFTNFLEKEYSHENIRFWNEVKLLRRSAHSQVHRKATEIYEEFLMPGAPCEINIDSKTMASVLQALYNPSRFTFDSASEHIYTLLLKKDCYPRFIRSEHYKRLLENGVQPLHKKRFFNFGGVGGAKKKMTAALSGQATINESASSSKTAMASAPPPGSLTRRRGSDRSLTGSAHELAVTGVNKETSSSKVPHSHSQSNLSEMPYSESVYRGDMPTCLVPMDAGTYTVHAARLKTTQDTPKPKLAVRLETTVESTGNSVCPWDLSDEAPAPTTSKSSAPKTTKAVAPIQQPVKKSPSPGTASMKVQLSICPWEQDGSDPLPTTQTEQINSQQLNSTSSEIGEVSERLQRTTLGIRHQNTVDSGEASMKRLMPTFTEQRRASMSFTPNRFSEQTLGRPVQSKVASTPSPTVGRQRAVDNTFAPLCTPLVSPTCTKKDARDEALSNFPDVTELPKQRSSASPSPSSTADSISVAMVDNPNADSLSVSQASPQEVVDEPVKEVEIQLIETINFVDPASEQTGVKSKEKALSRSATPTISVQECSEIIAASTSQSNSNSPSPQSPEKILADDLHVEIVKVMNEGTSSDSAMDRSPRSYTIPPPLPPIGPMEEEQLADEDGFTVQEELSPTTEEYQEGLQFGADGRDDYDYDLADSESRTGYIPPAPTPAPSMAPLAELDIDTVEDEPLPFDEEPPLPQSPVIIEATHTVETITLAAAAVEEGRKRRKKRSSESKKTLPAEEKERATTSSAEGGSKVETERNTICPWEDENVSPSDGTFVKTYATLGYL